MPKEKYNELCYISHLTLAFLHFSNQNPPFVRVARRKSLYFSVPDITYCCFFLRFLATKKNIPPAQAATPRTIPAISATVAGTFIAPGL